MKSSAGRSAILTGGARAAVLLRIGIAFLATAHLAALADAAAASNAAPGNPPLASLQIEIWPEFDRPAAALVILRGEIAADVSLPAAVSLRIPAATGGPSAVAYSAERGGSVFNLKYGRRDASDFITLEFDSPKRLFQVEFYEPVDTRAPGRSYTYTWSGDLATDRLNVILQEPAAASDLRVEPALDAEAVGQDGLHYRSADLGAFPAGKALEVKVRYTKTDPRTSAEIRKPQAPQSSTMPDKSPSERRFVTSLIVIVTVLALGATVLLTWRNRQTGESNPRSGKTAICGRCGAASASAGPFCSKCGTRLD